MRVVLAHEEGDDRAVRHNGQVILGMGGEDGVNRRREARLGLRGRFPAQDPLVRMGQQANDGRLERLYVREKGSALPVLFVQVRGRLPGCAQRLGQNAPGFHSLALFAGNKKRGRVRLNLGKQLVTTGTAGGGERPFS